MTPDELLEIETADVLRLLGGDEFVLVEHPAEDGGPSAYAAWLVWPGPPVSTARHATPEAAFDELVSVVCELINDGAAGPSLADALREVPEVPRQHDGRGHPRKPPRAAGPRESPGG
jgi:hypothetical protein